MAIRSIEHLKTNDLGDTDVVVCPYCKKATAMRLFALADRSAVARFKKKHGESIAVCPKCSAVFRVNQNFVDLRQSGTVCTMSAEDLDLMYDGHA